MKNLKIILPIVLILLLISLALVIIASRRNINISTPESSTMIESKSEINNVPMQDSKATIQDNIEVERELQELDELLAELENESFEADFYIEW